MSKPTRPDTREFSTTQGYLAAMEGWATHLEAENAELQKTPNELRRVLAEVRTENAELRKETESCADVNADLLDDLTRAVELLREAKDNDYTIMDDQEVDAFLTKMEDV
jgi:hypothetical protein